MKAGESPQLVTQRNGVTLTAFAQVSVCSVTRELQGGNPKQGGVAWTSAAIVILPWPGGCSATEDSREGQTSTARRRCSRFVISNVV
jgi:hypothetical protein